MVGRQGDLSRGWRCDRRHRIDQSLRLRVQQRLVAIRGLDLFNTVMVAQHQFSNTKLSEVLRMPAARRLFTCRNQLHSVATPAAPTPACRFHCRAKTAGIVVGAAVVCVVAGIADHGVVARPTLRVRGTTISAAARPRCLSGHVPAIFHGRRKCLPAIERVENRLGQRGTPGGFHVSRLQPAPSRIQDRSGTCLAQQHAGTLALTGLRLSGILCQGA